MIAQMSNKNQRHAQCANARAPSAVVSSMMVSLTPCYRSKQPRPVKLDNVLEFNPSRTCAKSSTPRSPFQMALSKFQRCEQNVASSTSNQVTISNTRCALSKIAKNLSSCSTCASPWLRSSSSTTVQSGKPESKHSECGTHATGRTSGYGSLRIRSPNGAMAVRREHRACPSLLQNAEPIQLKHLDLGETLDPDFLYPETRESQCAISKNTRKFSKDEAREYVQWIQSRIPDLGRKDERVYCAYCDMMNHPRWSCNHFSKHQNPNAKHSCTLCIGERPPFLCPRAQVNNGIARPNWAHRETRSANDQHRAPDLRWDPQDNLPPPPPPAEQPPAQMETADLAQQEAAPELTAPLCAAAVAMHDPPPSTTRPTSSM